MTKREAAQNIAKLAEDKLVANDRHKNRVIVYYKKGGYYRFKLPDGIGTAGTRGVDKLIKTLKFFDVHVNHVCCGYLLKPETLLKIANA